MVVFQCYVELSLTVFVLGFLPTGRACGQVGDLKLVRPNVFRYKLLMFNYLQMFNRFPSAETNVQKKLPNVQLLPSAPTCHKPMLAEVRLFLHATQILSSSFVLCHCLSYVNRCPCIVFVKKVNVTRSKFVNLIPNLSVYCHCRLKQNSF